MCTLLFFSVIFSVCAAGERGGWSPETRLLVGAFSAGFQAVAVILAFSSISGAHFNPAVTWALWCTNKTSNRKLVLYIFAQLLASVCAMCIVSLIFPSPKTLYDAIAVIPTTGDDARIFWMEFVLTYILTFVAFVCVFEESEAQKKSSMSFKSVANSRGLTLYASTPQSKTGFAPFAIGFTVFALNFIGGTVTGGAFNQARMFGPAIFSGKWDKLWLYWIAQFAGSTIAGMMVHHLHTFGLSAEDVSGVDHQAVVKAASNAIVQKGEADRASLAATAETGSVNPLRR